ncbi:MAG: NAD(P)-dependent oxidoreductase [Christensenellales bacterium]|jgi:phosphoglycerate dehydrogenase-like enzyme
MRAIRKVLSTVNYTGQDLKTLKEIFEGSEFIQVSHSDTENILKELVNTDVAVLETDLDERFLGDSSLKWIHCNHAGLNKSARPEVFEKGIILTGSAGRSSPVLAEHCIYFMLNACYHTHELLAAQYTHQWGVKDQDDFRGLFGRTAGIIGMGHTGKMLAERLNAFGMDIISYDRYELKDYDYITRKLNSSKGDSLDELYANSDFIILCIALTNETYHLINDESLAKFKRGAILVNMARGGIVDTEALIRALDSGQVAQAGLDVFEQEPLPTDSPLWDRKDVYITPHFTPAVPHRAGRCLEIIRENRRRYINNEEMLNEVKEKDIFTIDLTTSKY